MSQVSVATLTGAPIREFSPRLESHVFMNTGLIASRVPWSGFGFLKLKFSIFIPLCSILQVTVLSRSQGALQGSLGPQALKVTPLSLSVSAINVLHPLC